MTAQHRRPFRRRRGRLRVGPSRHYGKEAAGPMYVAAGGFIAGSAVVGFGAGVWRAQ